MADFQRNLTPKNKRIGEDSKDPEEQQEAIKGEVKNEEEDRRPDLKWEPRRMDAEISKIRDEVKNLIGSMERNRKAAEAIEERLGMFLKFKRIIGESKMETDKLLRGVKVERDV